MRKISQNTRFDRMVQQPNPPHWRNNPKQRLLFPTSDHGSNSHYGKEEEIEKEEKLFEELDLNYPELSEEQIKANPLDEEQKEKIKQQIQKKREDADLYPYSGSYYKNEADKLQEQLDRTDDNLEILQTNVRNKYNQLREISKKFYAAYLEANKLAETDISINFEGSYIDLFKNFANFMAAKITSGIGYLFGQNLERGGISYFFTNGLNIFNITSINYEEKMREINTLSKMMRETLEDYDRRKKLLKYLPKIQEESNIYLSDEKFINFLNWMEEYFPYHKKEIFFKALERIQDYGNHSGSGTISISDLVKFKTFKSIYEKAQLVATEGFKNTIEYNMVDDIRTAIAEQISYFLKNKIFKFHEFLYELKKSELDNIEQSNRIILVVRRLFDVDVRALFTFIANTMKKNNEEYYTNMLQNTIKNIDAEINRSDESKDAAKILAKKTMQDNIEKHDADIFNNFINELFSKMKNYVTVTDKKELIEAWGLRSVVQDLAHKMLKERKLINSEQVERILKTNAKDFERIANSFIGQIIFGSLPGLEQKQDYMMDSHKSHKKEPGFGGIGDVLDTTDGKFSVDNFVQYAHHHTPFIPKEVWGPVIKGMFRDLNYKGLNRISELQNSNYREVIKIFYNILIKDNKLDHNNFYKLYKDIKIYLDLYDSIRSNLAQNKIENDEVVQIITDGIRGPLSIVKDMENVKTFVDFIHNAAGELPEELIKKIISNKNFINFTKIAIVKKLFKSYMQIQSDGGIKGITDKFGILIKDLQKRKYISSNFSNNILLIINFFESNEEINPKSPMFSKLFEVASQIETDLDILKMGDALKDLLKNYKPKNKALFKLDRNIREDLRFRVLKDKDPRILRIGIETDCCQRLGGVGEIAARDSFMNHLSSVLILEWHDPEDNEWKLLTQSYFHYVPKDKSYILDNVENNEKNVNKFKEKTELTLEEIYGLYANEIKETLGVKYFIAGKGYSKISSQKFGIDARAKDPRFFDDRALTSSKRHHYSDYDEENSIDLLNPNFSIHDVKNKLKGVTPKEASNKIRKLIKSILSQEKFIKKAQANENIRNLSGVNLSLFGPQSWEYINQFMNELNDNLLELSDERKLGNQPLNFQTVIRNPSTATGFTGGLKSLFNLSISLWNIVSVQRAESYNIVETQQIVNELSEQINNAAFPESNAQNIKPQLVNILRNWLTILK